MKEAAPNREVVLGSNRKGDLPTASRQPAVVGLWRNLGLSRLERVKAHRDEFGSSLLAAVNAVDEDFGRQASTGRARLADAASEMLEALRQVRRSTEWSCMEADTQIAVDTAIAKATTSAETGAIGTDDRNAGGSASK